MPPTTGCSAALTDIKTKYGLLCDLSSSIRCRALSLLPTVSAAGLSRSCGRVSQDGNSMISIFGDSSLVEAAISSACREEGVTTIKGALELASHWFIA